MGACQVNLGTAGRATADRPEDEAPAVCGRPLSNDEALARRGPSGQEGAGGRASREECLPKIPLGRNGAALGMTPWREPRRRVARESIAPLRRGPPEWSLRRTIRREEIVRQGRALTSTVPPSSCFVEATQDCGVGTPRGPRARAAPRTWVNEARCPGTPDGERP